MQTGKIQGKFLDEMTHPQCISNQPSTTGKLSSHLTACVAEMFAVKIGTK